MKDLAFLQIASVKKQPVIFVDQIVSVLRTFQKSDEEFHFNIKPVKVYVKHQIHVFKAPKLPDIINFVCCTQNLTPHTLIRRPCRWEAEENKRGVGPTAGLKCRAPPCPEQSGWPGMDWPRAGVG